MTILDYNNDGFMDLFLLNGTYLPGISDPDGKAFRDTPDCLYRNNGNGTFTEMAAAAGANDRHWSIAAGAMDGKKVWAAALFDFDNDGDLDIFPANGIAEELVKTPPLLLENDGPGHFTNAGSRYSDYFRRVRSGQGAAVWDYDNDGDLDIVVSHVDLQATAALLQNDEGNRNHWLGLSLNGNAPAAVVGATVTLETEKKTQIAVNQWAPSYLSSNDPRIHFGLGKATTVNRLTVRWPDGTATAWENIQADQSLIASQNGKLRSGIFHQGQ